MVCGHSVRKEQCDQLLTFFCKIIFFLLSFPFHLLSINVVCTAKNVVFSAPSSWVGKHLGARNNNCERSGSTHCCLPADLPVPLMAEVKGYFLRLNLSIADAFTRITQQISNMHISLLCIAALEVNGEEISWVQSFGMRASMWEMATQT